MDIKKFEKFVKKEIRKADTVYSDTVTESGLVYKSSKYVWSSPHNVIEVFINHLVCNMVSYTVNEDEEITLMKNKTITDFNDVKCAVESMA